MVAGRAVEISTEPVVLFTAIGPYSAPIASLIWALHRERGLRVVEVFVVADRRGLKYVWADLLAENRILDQLRAVLGEDLVSQPKFHVITSRLPSGEIAEGDCFRETLWNTARDAIAAAGDARVVFGLTHGSRRTVTALQTSTFQLLARPHDLMIDVRIEDPRVDEDTPFFFPEQRDRNLVSGHAQIDARTVRIELIELELPRLAGVLDAKLLTGQTQLPALAIDLIRGKVTIDEAEVDLSIAERFWYAYLAHRRGESPEGWVQVGQAGHAEFLEFLQKTRARRWAPSIRTKPLRCLLEGEFVHDEDLRNLRGKTVQRMKRWCVHHRPELKALIIPETDGNGRQRLPLETGRITITGAPPR